MYSLLSMYPLLRRRTRLSKLAYLVVICLVPFPLLALMIALERVRRSEFFDGGRP